MMDSGTTTAEIARQIKFLKLKSLTVITNALNIAGAGQPSRARDAIGGILRQMSYSLVGPQEHLARPQRHRLFLGVDGLTRDRALDTGRPGSPAQRDRSRVPRGHRGRRFQQVPPPSLS